MKNNQIFDVAIDDAAALQRAAATLSGANPSDIERARKIGRLPKGMHTEAEWASLGYPKQIREIRQAIDLFQDNRCDDFLSELVHLKDTLDDPSQPRADQKTHVITKLIQDVRCRGDVTNTALLSSSLIELIRDLRAIQDYEWRQSFVKPWGQVNGETRRGRHAEADGPGQSANETTNIERKVKAIQAQIDERKTRKEDITVAWAAEAVGGNRRVLCKAVKIVKAGATVPPFLGSRTK